MILIRTDYDSATSYMYRYTTPILDFADKKGIPVVLLEGDDVSEAVLRSRLKRKKAHVIFFNGHGSESYLLDNKGRSFINTKNCDLLGGTVTYARACDSLVSLGPESVKNGCKAFIGYKKKFWIARSHKYECRPDRDPIARPELECSNEVMIQLLKGKSVQESIDKSHESSAKYILQLLYSNEPLAPASLQALIFNDSNLDFSGDGSTRPFNN